MTRKRVRRIEHGDVTAGQAASLVTIPIAISIAALVVISFIAMAALCVALLCLEAYLRIRGAVMALCHAGR